MITIRFTVITAMTMKSFVFWYLMQYNPVKVNFNTFSRILKTIDVTSFVCN
jgi:hypothetical protein